ncbi:MAG: hypothetical protein IPI33_10980 [Dehalococcoidia bacterium]|nr:hypothetical protein [Dehalococcoidia bacterium]
MLFTVRSGAFVAIAAVSALGFACGGGGSLEKVDAEDWVADVCDKAIDFDEASSDAIQPLAEADEDDAGELKDAIDDLVKDMTKAIDVFVEDIEDVGQPDIDGGDKVIAAIRDHAKDEKKALQGLQGRRR